MTRVVVADILAATGDGPDYLDYSQVLSTIVEETTLPPDR
jgi:hypothetical protein